MKKTCTLGLALICVVGFTWSQVLNDRDNVYVNPGEKIYHLAKCKNLGPARAAITLGDAKRRGYKPCSVCIFKKEESVKAISGGIPIWTTKKKPTAKKMAEKQEKEKWMSKNLRWHEKETLSLGDYTVEYYSGGPSRDKEDKRHVWGSVFLKDKNGNILKTIEDWGIDTLGWGDITGDGLIEFIITAYSGGAHCCFTYYIYSLKEKIETILIFNYMGGENFIQEIKDLNGDGVKEIIVVDGRFCYFNDFPFAGSPRINYILCYKDNKYRECRNNFSGLFEKELSKMLGKSSISESTALEIYAHFILLGREEEGWQKLMIICPDPTKSWLIKYRKEIIERMKWELPISYEQ